MEKNMKGEEKKEKKVFIHKLEEQIRQKGNYCFSKDGKQ